MNLDELDRLHAAATAPHCDAKWVGVVRTNACAALHNAWPAISARLRAAEAEVERLRAALAPFAAFAATLPPVVDESRLTDSGAIASGAVFADPAKAPLRFITYADVRRARAALGEP